MKTVVLVLAILTSAAVADVGVPPRHVRLPIPSELTRADLYIVSEIPRPPRAVLVLCPGMNGDGSGLLTREWRDFARQHRLGLVGLSFASSSKDLESGKGYYYPSRGAGKSLLDGLRTAFGGDLPILIYGMSGGAHFASRFTEWKPQRVISWCAYTAGWWDHPRAAAANPPGIVACGDEDVRYGATLGYFLQGRAIGKPWTWVSLSKTGHQSSPVLDEFVRMYFSAILQQRPLPGEWRDVDLKSPLDSKQVEKQPTLACWLPDDRVARDWIKIHQP